MARLQTAGFETQSFAAQALDGIVSGAGALTADTGTFRSGAAAAKCNSGAGNATVGVALGTGSTIALGTTVFYRWYVHFDTLPSGTVTIGQLGSFNELRVQMTSAGNIRLFDNVNSAQVGSDSATALATTAGLWYRLEVALRVSGSTNDDYGELLLDGLSVATSSTLNLGTGTTTDRIIIGWVVTSPGANAIQYIDDVAINDSTGATQNSWPGSARVVLLKPISDNAGGTGWTLGTGTALGGNGFAAVDNAPPLGVADLAAGSDPKQIRNANNTANTSYDANLTTYTDAGIGPSDTINVLTPIVATAAPVSTSAKQGTIGIASNPAITNVALGAAGVSGAFWSGTAGGTYPTGWKWSLGTATYAPSVTLGTSPVARITQVTASTRIAIVCFLGMYVDYTPATPKSLVYDSRRVARNSLLRR